VGMAVHLGNICGPRIISSKGKIVISHAASGQIVALGKHRYAKLLETRAGSAAAIGALSFKPEFLVVSWGARRSQGEIIWLAAAGHSDQRAAPDVAWASVVRSAAARRLLIRPDTDDARQAWARAVATARIYRKGRA
jgi:hypothetical protein